MNLILWFHLLYFMDKFNVIYANVRLLVPLDPCTKKHVDVFGSLDSSQLGFQYIYMDLCMNFVQF
jgi:hypothetical protein